MVEGKDNDSANGGKGVTGDQNAGGKNKVDTATNDAVSGGLTPRTTCPSCGGRGELRVYAPFEVWVSCTSCGYSDVFEYGTKEWATYVDLVEEWQARLFGGDEQGGAGAGDGGEEDTMQGGRGLGAEGSGRGASP